MNLSYTQYFPADFAEESRVWIYQANRLFSIGEALEIERMIESFRNQWNTHGQSNKNFIQLLFGQFLILMADETSHAISGCSIDSSVRFIKDIETKFKVSMFDRQALAFYVKDKVQVIPMSQLQYAHDNNFISGETLFFNNLVRTRKEFLNQWIVPAKSSWLATKVTL